MPTFVNDQRQKRERGSETVYAENVQMWTSSLRGTQKCTGRGRGVKTQQKESMEVYTYIHVHSIVLTF